MKFATVDGYVTGCTGQQRYQSGFALGELLAVEDRRKGAARRWREPRGEFERGRRDGYTPRTPEWDRVVRVPEAA